jgi:hypothetical protein
MVAGVRRWQSQLKVAVAIEDELELRRPKHNHCRSAQPMSEMGHQRRRQSGRKFAALASAA